MTEPKTIILAGEPRSVPALPLRLTVKAYPLCKKLANNGYAERYVDAVKSGGTIEVSDEELADLAEIAFYGASAADPSLTREAFDDLPVTPPELIDCYFPIRLQTGGWIASDPTASPEEGQEVPGEAQGAI